MIDYRGGFSRKCACGKRGITYNGQGEIVCFDHTSLKQKQQILDLEKRAQLKMKKGEKANG